jgi:hypothetical protein
LQTLILYSNALHEPIPNDLKKLTNLTDNGGLNLTYNALFLPTESETSTFITEKSHYKSWESTQTLLRDADEEIDGRNFASSFGSGKINFSFVRHTSTVSPVNLFVRD